MYIFSKWYGDSKEELRRKAYNKRQQRHLEDEIAYCLNNGWMVEYVYLVIE